VPTKAGWEDFTTNIYWREVVETIKARMIEIQKDILSPEVCSSEADVARFQGEYLSLLFVINLPVLASSEGEEHEESKMV